MTCCAPLRHNPCVMMKMLVDMALQQITKFTNKSVLEISLSQIFHMLEIVKNNCDFPEYRDVVIAFDKSRPKKHSREIFVKACQNYCRILGRPSPFTIDNEDLSMFKKFLTKFSKQLQSQSKICPEFE